jgi:hypothetical protein
MPTGMPHHGKAPGTSLQLQTHLVVYGRGTLEERNFGQTPVRVTIGLVEGHAVTGYMTRFSPTMSEIHFTLFDD